MNWNRGKFLALREKGFREEETLIPDPRARISPNEMVERKLMALLCRSPLQISHLRMQPRKRGPHAEAYAE